MPRASSRTCSSASARARSTRRRTSWRWRTQATAPPADDRGERPEAAGPDREAEEEREHRPGEEQEVGDGHPGDETRRLALVEVRPALPPHAREEPAPEERGRRGTDRVRDGHHLAVVEDQAVPPPVAEPRGGDLALPAFLLDDQRLAAHPDPQPARGPAGDRERAAERQQGGRGAPGRRAWGPWARPPTSPRPRSGGPPRASPRPRPRTRSGIRAASSPPGRGRPPAPRSWPPRYAPRCVVATRSRARLMGARARGR
jgi:hypothetical protein